MVTAEDPSPGRADRSSVVRFLAEGAWPAEPPEVIETHMSWVFLTGDRAFKLKKPVVQPYLDYRTLEARRIDCEAEVALNQPLAPTVYLGVQPLWRTGGRLGFHPDGHGEIVDWLVIMRRLHRTMMMDHRLADGDIDPASLEQLITVLVAFYRVAPMAPVHAADYREKLLGTLEADRLELCRSEYDLDVTRVRALIARAAQQITGSDQVAYRATRVVEGHGDLRPEHVVLGEAIPLVIDRITFNRALRCTDPAADLALLAIECERARAGETADLLFNAYRRLAADDVPIAVIELYRALRALNRARLSIAHLRGSAGDPAKWTARTEQYLTLAEAHLSDQAPAAR
ncbi:MAG: hypothetical protein ACKV2O_17605 [Acidimicrobiales bacterium]